MSAEDTFRRVLTARLPAGPGWTAWIDGTVQELAGSLPHPDLAAIAAAIDENYEEEDYRAVYSEEGVIVDSAAARAVLDLLQPGVAR